MADLAPVALFTYKRLQTTIQTINSLLKNKLANKTEVFIFSDKWKNKYDKPKVLRVIEYLENIKGFKYVEIHRRKRHFSASYNIIRGITEILKNYDKVIVLEDDIITSPYFLSLINKALKVYEDCEKVVAISGYTPPIPNLPPIFFIKFINLLGWATWKRGWELFEHDPKKILKRIEERGLEKEANLNGSYNLLRILKKQVLGKGNDWDVRYYFSIFLNDKLTLYFGKSLTQHIGYGKDSLHFTFPIDIFKTQVAQRPISVKKVLPKENQMVMKEIEKFYRRKKYLLFLQNLHYSIFRLLSR